MATEILRPNAAGDETNIANQQPTSGAHWDKVDEATPDDFTTYVYDNSQTDYKRDLYNIANHSVGSGTINFIKVYGYARGWATPDQANLKIAIKSGQGTGAPDTVSESGEITTTTSWAYYSNQWNTNPKTGNAWTWDEVDTLQAGIALRRPQSGQTYSSYCTQVYVEIDYGAAGTEKTSSDNGSGVDAYVSLEQSEAKTSSDTGSGVEGTPLPSATLAGSETGASIEAIIARLLAALDTGTGAEVGVEVGGLPKDLFAIELGWGNDSLIAKIEMPTKGGGMKLWT
jgi:hypothetical protein